MLAWRTMLAAAGTMALLLLASPKGAQALDVSRNASIAAIIALGILVVAVAAYGIEVRRWAIALWTIQRGDHCFTVCTAPS